MTALSGGSPPRSPPTPACCPYLDAGERPGVSLNTVSGHIKSVYSKLDVHSAGAAVMCAVQLRIVGEG